MVIRRVWHILELLRDAKIIKVLITKQKKFCNYTWCWILTRLIGQSFHNIHDIESLCHKPETNIMLYVNYISVNI